jgi:transcriptional regulator with XRE-family HTH domain
MAYSIDFRKKVLSIRIKERLTIAQTAQRFGVGVSTVVRWLKCPERKDYTRTKFRKIDPALLIEDVEAYPDAYQSERAERLGVHQNAIFYLLKKLNIIAKSINFDLILWIDFGYMTLFLRETGRENQYPLFAGFAIHIKKAFHHPKADAEKRRSFQEKIEVFQKDNRPIVYIDESGSMGK